MFISKEVMESIINLPEETMMEIAQENGFRKSEIREVVFHGVSIKDNQICGEFKVRLNSLHVYFMNVKYDLSNNRFCVTRK